MDNPRLVVDKHCAFLHLRGNNFLCLGDKREVLRADPKRLSEMIMESLAVSEYHDIHKSGQITH